MSSRPRLAAITSGTLLLMAGCPSRPATAVSDLELHRRAIVIDTHSDCTQRIAYDGIDFATAQPDMQVDLPKMRAGGLDAQFFSIFVGPWRTGPEGYYAEALKQFDAVHAMIRANPDTIAWARTAADVRANAERKRISALFGVEGGHALLRAVARNGGAVCVNDGSAFLDQDFYAREQAVWARVRGLGLPPRELWRTVREETARLPPVPLARLVDHIDHVAKVAGIDHVCLGSDFDGVPATPAGLEDTSKLPALTAELRRRGYGPADVEKILGGNVLRVLAANEPPALSPS